MSVSIPAGFTALHLRPNPYIEACGPLYGRLDAGQLVLGLRVEHRHCNPGGTCHGDHGREAHSDLAQLHRVPSSRGAAMREMYIRGILRGMRHLSYPSYSHGRGPP